MRCIGPRARSANAPNPSVVASARVHGAKAKPAERAPAHEVNKNYACPAALDSSVLLQGHKTVAISHNGSVYRLQATKLGKLILTK